MNNEMNKLYNDCIKLSKKYNNKYLILVFDRKTTMEEIVNRVIKNE